jgi:hypothetical protein
MKESHPIVIEDAEEELLECLKSEFWVSGQQLSETGREQAKREFKLHYRLIITGTTPRERGVIPSWESSRDIQ